MLQVKEFDVQKSGTVSGCFLYAQNHILEESIELD